MHLPVERGQGGEVVGFCLRCGAALDPGQTITPSKTICKFLDLHLKAQSSDLYNPDGKLISTTFRIGEGLYNKSTFCYIDKGEFDKYMRHSKKHMIWAIIMEKRFFKKGIKSISHGDGSSLIQTSYLFKFR